MGLIALRLIVRPVEACVKETRCLTINVLQSDSLPQIGQYSKAAELQALHMGDKENGDGGPVDAREASDHQGDGAPLQARKQALARVMLDELCALSAYNRSYAARLLRNRA